MLDFSKQQDIGILRIDNPSRANILNREALMRFKELLSQCEEDDGIRALIISGSGDKVFCGGADIGDWSDLSPRDYANKWVKWGHPIFDALARLRCPTIAALNGHSYGGGLELAAACDLRLAARDILFALPEPQLGIIPGWSGTQRLARELPAALLRELLFCGSKLSAERMHRCGFINQLVARKELMDAAMDMAKQIKRAAPIAVETAKLSLNIALNEGKAEAIEALAAASVSATEDANEGVRSFNEKREPDFKGK